MCPQQRLVSILAGKCWCCLPAYLGNVWYKPQRQFAPDRLLYGCGIHKHFVESAASYRYYAMLSCITEGTVMCYLLPQQCAFVGMNVSEHQGPMSHDSVLQRVMTLWARLCSTCCTAWQRLSGDFCIQGVRLLVAWQHLPMLWMKARVTMLCSRRNIRLQLGLSMPPCQGVPRGHVGSLPFLLLGCRAGQAGVLGWPSCALVNQICFYLLNACHSFAKLLQHRSLG